MRHCCVVFLLGLALARPVAAAPLCTPCIYVANQRTNDVTVIDAATKLPILTIPAGTTPQFIAAHPNGTRVYVSTHSTGNNGLVVVIDTSTLSPIAQVAVGLNPTGLAVNGPLNELYVLNSGDNSLTVIDTTSNAVKATMPLTVRPFDIVVSPDGKTFYLSSQSGGQVQAFDASKKTLKATLKKGVPVGLAFDALHARLYVADRSSAAIFIVDADTLKLLNAITASGPATMTLTVDPKTQRIYKPVVRSSGTTVHVLNGATTKNEGEIPTGKHPRGVAFHEASGTLYVSNMETADVTVINAQSKSVLATIPAGGNPIAMAIVDAPSASLDTCRPPILAGIDYEMDDPLWIVNTNQNKNTCAFRFLADLHELGYNTSPIGTGLTPPVATLKVFLERNNLPAGSKVTKAVLGVIDAQLAVRRALIAPIANAFPLYNIMQPLHRNDVSRNWLAHLEWSAMLALPKTLQLLDPLEAKFCIGGQCTGKLIDVTGKEVDCGTGFSQKCTGWAVPHRYSQGYFNASVPSSDRPSASALLQTMLHEYGHYLDAWVGPQTKGVWPHRGVVDTDGFYDILYDFSTHKGLCAPKRSSDVQNWISDYANEGGSTCTGGMAYMGEAWAEAFATYVHDGQSFRAAAAKNVAIDKQYQWLKTHVFEGTEFDTNLQRDGDSGCTDAPGKAGAVPGYLTCSATSVWDGLLKKK